MSYADVVLANSNAMTEAIRQGRSADEIRNSAIAKALKGLTSPNIFCYVAETVDEPQKIVGCAKWVLFREEYKGEDPPKRSCEPGGRTILEDDFAAKVWEGRQTFTKGKAHVRTHQSLPLVHLCLHMI